MTIVVNNLKEFADAARQIIGFAKEEKILLFYGEMGAGKTTLISEICRQLGVEDNTSSPTFSIINEYRSGQKFIYHFDFYRLKNQQEALDLGYEDYFFSDNWCFVEWPEKIPDLLPEHYLKIEIEIGEQNRRKITLNKID